MKKKILSMVLALFMVLGLFPTMAHAAGGDFGQTTTYSIPTTTAATYDDTAASPIDYEVSVNAVTIKTAKGMAWLTQNSAYWSSTYTITLANDIVVSAFLWSPIGNDTIPFAGTFDGAGNKVIGIYLHNADNMQGLFGKNTGTIINVGVANSDIAGARHVGAIVGYNYAGTVRNCWNSGSTDNIGGIVGDNYYSYVYNSYNTGAISGRAKLGGIAGYNLSSDIYNSYNTGTVSSGDTTAGFYVRGVVGHLYSGTVSCCYYRAHCATNGQSKAQNGIGTGTINTAGADVNGTTNTFTGTGASCVLSNASVYTITNSAGA